MRDLHTDAYDRWRREHPEWEHPFPPIMGADDTPVEEVEEQPEPSDTGEPGEADTPPWGDEFDAKKAWDTITRQRDSERELKERLRRFEDESERDALLKEWGYELADDDEPDDDGDPDELFDEEPRELRDPRVDELLRERDKERIRADLDRFNEESGWELDDEDRRRIEIDARILGGERGFGPAELEKAHEAYVARLDRAAEIALERARNPTPKPKAPHVTRGKAATQTKNVEDMTRRELDDYMVERAQANA